MDKAQFEREKNCGATVAIAKQLLHRKLITLEEYQKLITVLAQKYRPMVSSFPKSTIKTGEERSAKCKKLSKS